MTKKEYENKLQDLQNQLEELKKVEIEEEPKVWKPKNGETYYAIYAGGSIFSDVWADVSTDDNDCYALNNCFKTKEQAEFEKEKRIIRTKFKRYLKEHNGKIGKIDIGDCWYCLELNTLCETISYNCHNLYIPNDYVAISEEILREAVDFIGGEKIAMKYLFDIEE